MHCPTSSEGILVLFVRVGMCVEMTEGRVKGRTEYLCTSLKSKLNPEENTHCPAHALSDHNCNWKPLQSPVALSSSLILPGLVLGFSSTD